MTNDFSMPGQVFTVDNQIAAEYGNGGSQAPYVAVLTVAAGERVSDPAAASRTGRVFDAIEQAAGSVRITDLIVRTIRGSSPLTGGARSRRSSPRW
jgi:hypothetical protein